MADKKFTPQEAALAVLKKAEELYKASTLAKGDWAKIHSKLKREGYSEESADKIDGAIKAKVQKSDEEGHNPDEKADAALGEKVEQEVQDHEENNSDPSHEKGHIKLAKFVGSMQAKRGTRPGKEMDKAEDPLSSVAGDRMKRAEGYKKQGDTMSNKIAVEGAKDSHKERLAGIQAAPKPKLGKGM